MNGTLSGTLLTDATLVRAADGLSAADLDGEAVVLSPHTGMYYGLNEVGARAFELVATPQAFGRVVETLGAEFDVPEAQLRADLVAFFDSMIAERLVEPAA